MTKTKAFNVMVKAASDDSGQFEAIVSVFGNVDSYGDVVMAGAFTETLASWDASGRSIPVIWSHDWGDPDSHIGVVLEAKELFAGDPKLPAELADNGGLWVKGQLDDDGKAAKVRKLLKGGRVSQFSFAYDVLDATRGERDGQPVLELRKMDLHEVGPTLIGANRETVLMSAKSSESAILGQIRDLIEGKSAPEVVATDGDAPAKADEPATHPAIKAHPVDPRIASARLALLDAS